MLNLFSAEVNIMYLLVTHRLCRKMKWKFLLFTFGSPTSLSSSALKGNVDSFPQPHCNETFNHSKRIMEALPLIGHWLTECSTGAMPEHRYSENLMSTWLLFSNESFLFFRLEGIKYYINRRITLCMNTQNKMVLRRIIVITVLSVLRKWMLTLQNSRKRVTIRNHLEWVP